MLSCPELSLQISFIQCLRNLMWWNVKSFCNIFSSLPIIFTIIGTWLIFLSIYVRTVPKVYNLFLSLWHLGPWPAKPAGLSKLLCCFCTWTCLRWKLFGGGGTAGISPLEKKLYEFSSSSHLLELNTCVDVLKVFPDLGVQILSFGW